MKLEASEFDFFNSSLSHCLHGKVTPSLRSVSYELLEKTIWVSAIYDENISDFDKNLIQEAFQGFAEGMLDGFETKLLVSVEHHTKRQTMSPELIYLRYERDW